MTALEPDRWCPAARALMNLLEAVNPDVRFVVFESMSGDWQTVQATCTVSGTQELLELALSLKRDMQAARILSVYAPAPGLLEVEVAT